MISHGNVMRNGGDCHVHIVPGGFEQESELGTSAAPGMKLQSWVIAVMVVSLEREQG